MKRYMVTVRETIYRQAIVTEGEMDNIAADVLDNYSDYDWVEISEPGTEVVEIREEEYNKGTLWVKY